MPTPAVPPLHDEPIYRSHNLLEVEVCKGTRRSGNLNARWHRAEGPKQKPSEAVDYSGYKSYSL